MVNAVINYKEGGGDDDVGSRRRYSQVRPVRRSIGGRGGLAYIQSVLQYIDQIGY